MYAVGRHEEQLGVLEADLATDVRFGAREENILLTKANLALCYYKLGRHEHALDLRREVYARAVALNLPQRSQDAMNLASSMVATERWAEAKSLLREQLPAAQRALGADHDTVIHLRWIYADSLRTDAGASREDLVEAVTLLDELSRKTQRIYGTAYPLTCNLQGALGLAREKLAAFDTSK